MTALNGQLIVDVLDTLEQPATLKVIVSNVAEACGTKTNQVQDTVKEILKGGVQHGYVQYSNRKYFTANVDDGCDLDIKTPIKKNVDKQPEDVSRRRRSSSRRSQRSRSRSGARRRRSRRRSSTRR